MLTSIVFLYIVFILKLVALQILCNIVSTYTMRAIKWVEMANEDLDYTITYTAIMPRISRRAPRK